MSTFASAKSRLHFWKCFRCALFCMCNIKILHRFHKRPSQLNKTCQKSEKMRNHPAKTRLCVLYIHSQWKETKRESNEIRAHNPKMERKHCQLSEPPVLEQWHREVTPLYNDSILVFLDMIFAFIRSITYPFTNTVGV